MDIFKLLMCMTVILSSLGIGLFYSFRLTERTRVLAEYVNLLEEAAIRIPYTLSNLAVLFSDNFAGVTFVSDQPFAPQFCKMTEHYADVLTLEDIRLLNDFTVELGSGDADSQLKHIRLYSALLREHLDHAKKEVADKAKLYRILPLSIGIVAAILLI